MKFKTAQGQDISIDEIMEEIFELVTEPGFDRNSIIVGTDAQVLGKRKARHTKYSTVIVVLQGGDPSRSVDNNGNQVPYLTGQRRFWVSSTSVKENISIKARLMSEVAKVVEVVTLLQEKGIEGLVDAGDFCVHIDVGHNGRSREVITECVGWIEGLGVRAVIKPESFVATHVADFACRN
jgi:hypothetical protein